MKAKKSLGQHFLTSEGALKKIIEAADVAARDTVLEIGPGRGALTEALLESGCAVVAVEKDEALASFLGKKFEEEIRGGKLTVVSGDVLELAPEELPLKAGDYKLVANIPYYITGAILEKFLGSDCQPSRMVLLVQKEVAERIARDKKGSLLSNSVRAYGTPTYVSTVKRGSFVPAPGVDSAILLVEDISKNNFKNGKEEEEFFNILKTGFAHKRKLLAGNLAVRYGRKEAAEAFTVCGIGEKARAEELSIDEWQCLAENLEA